MFFELQVQSIQASMGYVDKQTMLLSILLLSVNLEPTIMFASNPVDVSYVSASKK